MHLSHNLHDTDRATMGNPLKDKPLEATRTVKIPTNSTIEAIRAAIKARESQD